MKKDSQLSKALDGLANHKDMKEKGISAESLKSGTIQPLIGTNEIKITRPENRTINAAGSKVETQSKQNVQNQKSKDFAL